MLFPEAFFFYLRLSSEESETSPLTGTRHPKLPTQYFLGTFSNSGISEPSFSIKDVHNP